MKATESEVRQMWEKTFQATLPESLTIQVAAEAVMMQRGDAWVEAELRAMRTERGTQQ